jgi:hypothetical protein
MMAAMDRSIAWRAALLQGGLLIVVALILASLLDKSFFESWGWLAGPGAWALCALAAGTFLKLPWLPVLIGAAIAGIPSLITVFIGVHWLGAPFGVAIFAIWCGRLAARRAADGGRLSPATAA